MSAVLRFDPALIDGIAASLGVSAEETQLALIDLESKGLARLVRRRGLVVAVQPLVPDEFRAEHIAEGFNPDPAPLYCSAFGNIRREPR